MTRAAPDFAKPCLRKIWAGCRWLPARIHRDCCCTIHGGDENTVHPWRSSCDRYPHLAGEVDGKPASIERVWTARHEIEQWEFDYLTADSVAVAGTNAPDADPYKKIDISEREPIF